MRREGQRVAMGDTLAFRSMKAGLYLHVSAAAFDGNAGTRREVPAAYARAMRRTHARAPPQVCGTSQPAEGDGMRVCPYSDFDAAAEECVRGGDIVRFWHAEVRPRA